MRRTAVVGCALVLLAVSIAAFLLRNYVHIGRSPAPVDAEVQEFWKPLLADPQGPLTIFSNAPFAGNAISGLRYELPGQRHSTNVHSFYTGIGEALAIHKLDSVFSQLRVPLRLRPGSLVSLEEVKGANLIFIGAPVENLMLNKVVTFRHFAFRELTSGPRTGQVVIDNLNPLPNEPPVYMGVNPPEAAVVDDYALIARMPIDSTHIGIAAAGTTTIGTEAAIEYLCQKDTLTQLKQKLGPIGPDSDFELILHIGVVDDVPMKMEIVTVRKDGKST